MTLFDALLTADPAAPRLTVYNEATGARMDFSAQTLDNWASKIANMLEDELDLEDGALLAVDLPASWQAAVIIFGAIAARIDVEFTDTPGTHDAVFTSPEKYDDWAGAGMDVVLVSDDPFGRGIEESGGELPLGALDFGPVVRFYGDQYFGDSPALADVVKERTSERLLSTGWTDYPGFEATVLSPLAGGGSAVVVVGVASAERLDAIATSEKTTARS